MLPALIAVASAVAVGTRNLKADLSRYWATHFGIGGGSTDWIPAKDQDLDAFAINFDTLITASPATYALQASDATAFHTNRLDFTTKLATSTNPITKTEATVAAKDASKAVLKANLRTLAGLVQASPAVTEADKINLGLPIDTNTPAPIPAPETMPLLNFIKAGVLTHELRYADELTPDSARRPAGVIGVELHVQVSATPIVDQEDVAYRTLATRNPVLIEYSADDKGKQAYVCGRWITARGLVGPWSELRNFTVAA